MFLVAIILVDNTCSDSKFIFTSVCISCMYKITEILILVCGASVSHKQWFPKQKMHLFYMLSVLLNK